MTDFLVHNGLRIIVMMLIAVLGVAALYLAYSGMLGFLGQRWSEAAPAIVISMVLGVFVYLLAYHRGDIVSA